MNTSQVCECGYSAPSPRRPNRCVVCGGEIAGASQPTARELYMTESAAADRLADERAARAADKVAARHWDHEED